MGKRKYYKQAYGKGSAEDAKRFKYSGQAIHSKDSTRGFLFSYRSVYILFFQTENMKKHVKA